MGMDCKGVRTIINFGPSKKIESYMQESGRCGRDGEDGRSIILYFGRMLRYVSKEMKEFTKLTRDSCRTKFLLKFFYVTEEETLLGQNVKHKHQCCDLCADSCDCNLGVQSLKIYFQQNYLFPHQLSKEQLLPNSMTS